MSSEKMYKGYTFASDEEYLEAKKESEAVAYLRGKTDFENAGQVLSLYNRMIDRKMVNTPIGLDFLKELREVILKSEVVSADKVRPLPELKKTVKKPVEKVVAKDSSEQLKKLRRQNTGLRIVIAGLLAVIIGMFVIVLTGKSSPLKSVYEKEILDKYAFWEQQLSEKEDWIRDMLYELEKQGITIEKESEPTDGPD